MPKSAGSIISYVDGLLRMALAWIPALWVKAQKPVMGELLWVVSSMYSARRASRKEPEFKKKSCLQWDVDLNGLCNEILNILEFVQLVLAHDIVPVGHDHTRHEATQRGDAVPLANSHH